MSRRTHRRRFIITLAIIVPFGALLAWLLPIYFHTPGPPVLSNAAYRAAWEDFRPTPATPDGWPVIRDNLVFTLDAAWTIAPGEKATDPPGGTFASMFESQVPVTDRSWYQRMQFDIQTDDGSVSEPQLRSVVRELIIRGWDQHLERLAQVEWTTLPDPDLHGNISTALRMQMRLLGARLRMALEQDDARTAFLCLAAGLRACHALERTSGWLCLTSGTNRGVLLGALTEMVTSVQNPDVVVLRAVCLALETAPQPLLLTESLVLTHAGRLRMLEGHHTAGGAYIPAPNANRTATGFNQIRVRARNYQSLIVPSRTELLPYVESCWSEVMALDQEALTADRINALRDQTAARILARWPRAADAVVDMWPDDYTTAFLPPPWLARLPKQQPPQRTEVLARLVLAIEIYHAERGHEPRSLDDLLARDPTLEVHDPVTGLPIQYHRYVGYTLLISGDNIVNDDGETVPTLELCRRVRY